MLAPEFNRALNHVRAIYFTRLHYRNIAP